MAARSSLETVPPVSWEYESPRPAAPKQALPARPAGAGRRPARRRTRTTGRLLASAVGGAFLGFAAVVAILALAGWLQS